MFNDCNRDCSSTASSYTESEDQCPIDDNTWLWSKQEGWLAQSGYELRPRSHYEVPQSSPLGQDKHKHVNNNQESHFAEAVCLADKNIVSLKWVQKSQSPYEVDIAQYLRSYPISTESINHCAPLHDILQVPNDEDAEILVMPQLREFDHTVFGTVREAVDFFQQALEGMQFMHKHRIAYRNFDVSNIRWITKPIHRRRNKNKHQRAAPHFYYTNFSLACKYDKNFILALEDPTSEGSPSAPEFECSNQQRHSFATDVYHIGNFMQQQFLHRFHGLRFMNRLISDMTCDNPSDRPTMDEVMGRFTNITHIIPLSKLRSPLLIRNTNWLTRRFYRTWNQMLSFKISDI